MYYESSRACWGWQCHRRCTPSVAPPPVRVERIYQYALFFNRAGLHDSKYSSALVWMIVNDSKCITKGLARVACWGWHCDLRCTPSIAPASFSVDERCKSILVFRRAGIDDSKCMTKAGINDITCIAPFIKTHFVSNGLIDTRLCPSALVSMIVNVSKKDSLW